MIRAVFDTILAQPAMAGIIAVFAFSSASYLKRHLENGPRQQDITQPPQDLSWRTAGRFWRQLLILASACLGFVLIFAPGKLGVGSPKIVFLALFVLIGAAMAPDIVQGRAEKSRALLDEYLHVELNGRLRRALIVVLALAPFAFTFGELLSRVTDQPGRDAPVDNVCPDAGTQATPCRITFVDSARKQHLASAIRYSREHDRVAADSEWEALRRKAAGENVRWLTDELVEEDLREVVALATRVLGRNPRDAFALEIRGNALWRLGYESAAQDDDDRLAVLRFGPIDQAQGSPDRTAVASDAETTADNAIAGLGH